MAFFTSTTSSGYSDPLKAMSIKALEARQKQLTSQPGGSITPENTQTPIQGVGHVVNQLADSMQQYQAMSAAASQRERLAQTIAHMDVNNPKGEELAVISSTDPEMLKDMLHTLAENRRAAATNATTQRGQDITGAGVHEGHVVTQQGNQLTADTTRRGQDIVADTAEKGRGTTERGQDIVAGTAARGQDIVADTAEKGRGTTERGQDITAGTTQRGQDIVAGTTQRGQDIVAGTTQRGQDIVADTAEKGRVTTERGQDITAGTTQRGQDIVAGTTQRGQDIVAGTTTRGQDIVADTAEKGRKTTERGQDTVAGTTQRGQDIVADTAEKGRGTTERGQDLSAVTAGANQDVTMRGQDLVAEVARLRNDLLAKQTKPAAIKDLGEAKAQYRQVLSMQKDVDTALGYLRGGINEGFYQGTQGFLANASSGRFGDLTRAQRTTDYNNIANNLATMDMSKVLKGSSTDREMQAFRQVHNDPTASPTRRREALENLLTAMEADKQIYADTIKAFPGGSTEGIDQIMKGPGPRADSAPPAAGGGDKPTPQFIEQSLANARTAISKGKDPEFIKSQLQKHGIDPKGL